ncbi:hypothetical protein WA026_018336 [Henosepilachna vigintioctopunctata]|uniref:Uncharacterized protein n=1 Tax=Henosepilachna vigintioctopunctata TaxID=420089 RepID=A0AAW1V8V0_9CUCU
MRILAAENQWKLALSVAEKTISLLKRGNKNISLLCEVYNSALDISSIHGDTHTYEQLEKCVVSVLMQLYSINNPIEFFAMAKLMSTLFVIKTKTDNITNAIRIGYRLYHLNYGLHAEIFQMETVPILADLLVSAKRIEDAAYAVGVTRKMMKNTLYGGESLYFIFCCDLLLDTSFYLEKIDAIEKFAEKMYLECDNSMRTNATTKKYLIICLLTYFSRLCNWNKVEKWKCYCDVPSIFKNDYNQIKFKLRFLELNLLQVARSLSAKNTKTVIIEAEFKVIKKLVNECLVLSKNWSLFLPKCYLYVAYHYKLKTHTKHKKYIKLGLKEAEINRNLSTKCWINLNDNYWSIGHNNFLISDFPFVLWKKAREYTIDQWTQIMFPLPLP